MLGKARLSEELGFIVEGGGLMVFILGLLGFHFRALAVKRLEHPRNVGSTVRGLLSASTLLTLSRLWLPKLARARSPASFGPGDFEYVKIAGFSRFRGLAL